MFEGNPDNPYTLAEQLDNWKGAQRIERKLAKNKLATEIVKNPNKNKSMQRTS